MPNGQQPHRKFARLFRKTALPKFLRHLYTSIDMLMIYTVVFFKA